MKILYITYVDLVVRESGSSVRPIMMYAAMQALGHEVYAVRGPQGRYDKQTRCNAVKLALEWLNENTPDFCYIESSTYPIMHSCDYNLIRQVVRSGIRTAFFYRDCYMRFPKFGQSNVKKSLGRVLKDMYLKFKQYRTDNLLQIVDIVYFPTQRMADLFGYKNKKVLMPAASNTGHTGSLGNKAVCIYVGGLSKEYGSDMLLESFKILNNGGVFGLILVCRKKEFEESVFSKPDLKQLPWLKVYHVSSPKELELLYEQASLALLPQKPGDYINMAIAVKFFEYLGEGLPIVSAGAYEMSKLIRENNLGIVTEHTPEAFAAGIRLILSESDKYAGYINSISSFMSRNQWTDRVNQIVCDLCRMKDSV